jgi:hypothetical protein
MLFSCCWISLRQAPCLSDALPTKAGKEMEAHDVGVEAGDVGESTSQGRWASRTKRVLGREHSWVV